MSRSVPEIHEQVSVTLKYQPTNPASQAANQPTGITGPQLARYPDFSTADVSPTVVSEPDVLAIGPLAEGRFVDEHFGAGPLADGRFVDEHFGAGPLADVKCATPLYKILSSHISLAIVSMYQ